MSPFVPLLALPFLLGASLALMWLRHRLPPGWRGVVLGFAALAALSLLTLGGWMFSLSTVTWAHYACTDCGRVEKQTHIGPWTVSRALASDDEEYVKRFAPQLPREHEHHWHLESCLYSYRGVACTLERVQGWFQVLPKIADHAAADELFREAQALPYEQRCKLMEDVGMRFAFADRDPGGLDRAFESWRAQRR
jgi:hypothetical protein